MRMTPRVPPIPTLLSESSWERLVSSVDTSDLVCRAIEFSIIEKQRSQNSVTKSENWLDCRLI